jgi:hypothetical protein
VSAHVVYGRLPAGVGVQGARFADGCVVVVVDRRAFPTAKAMRRAAARVAAHLAGQHAA